MISHVAEFDQFNLFFSLIIGLAAGFIKGLVGFAMPMILLSGLTFMVSADAALAALILPTFFSNIQQSMVNGISSTINSIGRFKMFLSTGGLFLMLGALLTPYIPSKLLLGILGCLIVFFSLLQVNGPKLKILEFNSAASACFAAFAGFFWWHVRSLGSTSCCLLNCLKYGKKRANTNSERNLWAGCSSTFIWSPVVWDFLLENSSSLRNTRRSGSIRGLVRHTS